MAQEEPQSFPPEAGIGDAAPHVAATPAQLPLDPFAYNGAHLHDVPLALLPQQIAIVVRERGALTEDVLPDALAERFHIEVPPNRRRLLTSFAWSAGGRKCIEHDGHQWLPGTEHPHPIDHLGSWTMSQIENLRRELVAADTHPDDLFDQVIAAVWASTSRAPRPVAKAVGSCIYAIVGRR